MDYHRIHVIDSHTGGEPTRVVLDGGPELGNGPLSERLLLLRDKHDDFRRAVVCEPRGSDVLVGALLCRPTDKRHLIGVIFFNNVGYLGMCGHGIMGVMVSLARMACLKPDRYHLETPVGIVAVDYLSDNEVVIRNVPSFRHAAAVTVEVEGVGPITGDVAWGGNWFFLVENHGQELSPARIEELTAFTWKIRQALQQQGVTGADDAVIDHIELFGPPTNATANSKNFVLCPGKAYDRSPCGTGTSAKMACLIADGKLQSGEVWRQESIIGSIFEASAVVQEDGQIIPFIRGSAYVTAEATLLQFGDDPFRAGIGE